MAAPDDALPARAASRRRRPRHLGALAAALLYGAAGYAAFVIAAPLWEDDGHRSGIGAVAGASSPSLSTGTKDLLARRALAARAQPGVYVVEAAAGGRGSAFVAWVQPAKHRSDLITAHAAVAGVLADGGRTVYVRRGSRFWPGRIIRADAEAGLVLVRVQAVLDRPLWQERDQRATLAPGDPALIVPSGPGTAFGEGAVTRIRPDRFELRAGAAPLYLGAPVVAANGRLAGVVVGADAGGVNRIVPIAEACGKIRPCP